METRLLKSREILTSFLQRWPIDRVKTMSLSDYVDIGNPDTFCQWIETKTRGLGSIKGHFSNKFGIYKRKNPDEKPSTLVSDAIYSWLRYYGETRNEAFKNVKKDIISIILASQSRDFSSIDEIHLNHLVKWKVAFLYSDEKLVPIFKKDVLWRIAEAQGLTDAKKRPISRVNAFIFGHKPTNRSVYQFAADLYNEFGGEKSTNTAYYLIGSKYGEHAEQDMFPLMEEYSVVSTGFAWDYDLSHLFRANPNEISTELKKKGEPAKSFNALSHFLQLF